jgi:hypothetical protein
VEARHSLCAAGHITKSLAATDCIDKMRYRFPNGSPGHRGHSRLLPVIKRISPIPGLLMMVRQELPVTLDRIGAKLDHGSRDPPVQLGPLVAKRVLMAASWISACLN